VAHELAHDLTSATPTLADRVLTALAAASGPLDDETLARRARATSRQAVTLVCRTLEASGRVHREAGSDGKPLFSLAARPDAAATPEPAHADAAPPRPTAEVAMMLTEDQVKRAVRDYLTAAGYLVHVTWGHTRGVDILAERGHERLLLEAKGQVARRPRQTDYFSAALGELIQRMDDPNATYGLGLPDHPQYCALVEKLPDLVWSRLNLVVYLVSEELTVREVRKTIPARLF
jgi:hypothetical protein